MPNLNQIANYEKAINENSRLIAKKKNAIPFITAIIVLIYIVVFNLRESYLSNYFNNQIDFIKSISYFFIGIVLFYFTTIFYQISKLSKQTKEWKISRYKLTRLEQDNS